MISTTYPRDY